MSEAKDRIIYIFLKTFIRIFSMIPRKLMNWVAIPLGCLWYGIDKNHRVIAAENMAKAFGDEINEKDIPEMVKANFIQLTTAVLEMPGLFKLEKDNLDKYVTFSGSHNLVSAISQKKGVLFLTAHLGNWELMILATPLKFGFSCNLLVRPLDFKPMDRILSEIRSRKGNKVLDKIRSASTIQKILANNGILGIMLDQNASWYDGVYVPFFGRTACTYKSPSLFALRYDPVVLPIFNIRQPDGRYKIMFDTPVTLQRSGNINRDLVENSAIFNQIIEKHIRMAPDNWLWVHRRWRLKEIPEKAKKKMAALTL